MSLFKPEVRITAGQVKKLAGAKDDGEYEVLHTGNQVLDWKLRQVADALGFTNLLQFEAVAKSLGAAVIKDSTGTWVDYKSAAGVPAHLAARLAALKNLEHEVLRQYAVMFEELVSTGTTLKEAQKAALDAVQAYMKTRLHIINKRYPEQYTSLVNQNLGAKLKKDFSGLQGL